MPSTSLYPDVEIPKTDIFSFLFERNDKSFPDDKIISRDPYTGRTYTWLQTKNTAIDFGKGLKGAWEWKKGKTLSERYCKAVAKAF